MRKKLNQPRRLARISTRRLHSFTDAARKEKEKEETHTSLQRLLFYFLNYIDTNTLIMLMILFYMSSILPEIDKISAFILFY